MLTPENQQMAIKVHHLTDRLLFGKHQGKDLLVVIEEDPGWVRWAVENVDHFDIDAEAEEALIEAEADAEIDDGDFGDWGDRF